VDHFALDAEAFEGGAAGFFGRGGDAQGVAGGGYVLWGGRD